MQTSSQLYLASQSHSSCKSTLSNKEKKELIKIWTNAKKEPKEHILKSIICYAIWNPDEAIKEARRKGIFRYKIFGMGEKENNAQYYLKFLDFRDIHNRI